MSRKCILRNLTTVLFIFIIGSAYATDLIDVYRDALQHDPIIKSAQAQSLADREEVAIHLAPLLPQAAVSGSSTYNRIDDMVAPDFSGVGTKRFNSHVFDAVLDQSLINVSNWVRLAQASRVKKKAYADFIVAHQDLILRVAEAYFDVLLGLEQLRTTQAEKEATGKQLEQARQQYNVGMIAITDVHSAQADYDNVVAAEITAENEVANRREALREITSKFYPHLAKLHRKFPFHKPRPNIVEPWVCASDKQNFSIRAAKYSEQIAKSSVNVVRAEHLPTLDAQLGYEHSDSGNRFGSGASESKAVRSTLEFNFPVFQGGGVLAETRQAKYNYQNARAQTEEVIRRIHSDTRQSFNNIISGISKIKADRQAIVSNKSSVESMRAEYEVGSRTIVDVLDSLQDLYEVERIYASDRYAYIISTLRLKRAAGILSVEDLYGVNNWLLA